MSIARGAGQNGGHFYSNITKPIELDCNFVVDSTNGNGLGIRSLKSNGYIRNVFMNTSATPGMNKGMTNPNPQAGFAFVQFENNFNYYLGGFSGLAALPTSTSTTSLTAGHVYMITSVGTTTAAQWQTAGLQAGLTPTVGQAFVSLITGSLSGSGTVGVPGVPLVTQLSVVGDPNTTIANSQISPNGGAIILVQFLAPTNASTTTLASTSPVNGTVVAMTFKFDGSIVTIDGL